MRGLARFRMRHALRALGLRRAEQRLGLVALRLLVAAAQRLCQVQQAR